MDRQYLYFLDERVHLTRIYSIFSTYSYANKLSQTMNQIIKNRNKKTECFLENFIRIFENKQYNANNNYFHSK